MFWQMVKEHIVLMIWQNRINFDLIYKWMNKFKYDR